MQLTRRRIRHPGRIVTGIRIQNRMIVTPMPHAWPDPRDSAGYFKASRTLSSMRNLHGAWQLSE